MSAEEGDYDKIIKEIKKEFDATQPRGNSHSSVIQQGSGKPAGTGDSKEVAYSSMANFMKEQLGK